MDREDRIPERLCLTDAREEAIWCLQYIPEHELEGLIRVPPDVLDQWQRIPDAVFRTSLLRIAEWRELVWQLVCAGKPAKQCDRNDHVRRKPRFCLTCFSSLTLGILRERHVERTGLTVWHENCYGT